jgi:8-oxo-dGTP pyrophosphatase MutT (NUDIX family)
MTNTGAGIILTRTDTVSAEPRYFLLCGKGSGIWSFSKGHGEVCDGGCPLRTAVRETQEETGLVAGADYTLLLNESQRFGKRPYWIGVVKPHAKQHMRLSAREHMIGGWFTLEEIGRLKSNVDVRAWYKKASNPNSNFRVRIERVTSLSSERKSKHSFVEECTAS